MTAPAVQSTVADRFVARLARRPKKPPQTTPKQVPLVGTVITHPRATPVVVVRRRMPARIAVGLWTAPKALRAYLLVTELDGDLAAARASKDQAKVAWFTKQQEDVAKGRRERTSKVVREILPVLVPSLAGGWVGAVIILAVVLAFCLWLKKRHGSMRGDVCMRVAEMLVVAVAWWAVMLSIGVGYGLRPGWVNVAAVACVVTAAVTPAVVWAVIHTRDDGTIADDLRAGEKPLAPTDVARDDKPEIVRAAIATGALPKDADPILVQPGVAYRPGGKSWSAVMDTGGPSAEVFLSGRPRRELAARLHLSVSRTVFTVDRDCGSRLHIVGVTGDQWADMPPHPLLSGSPVDLWQPVPFGQDVEGNVVTYQSNGVHCLFGGETGAGKSVAMATVWCAYALSPTSDIYGIDGGEADSFGLQKYGIATAWTQDRAAGIEILHTVRAEMNRRQRLLRDSDALEEFEASPEWMAEHGLGHLLLFVDELPTFTQDKSDDAKLFADILREILQKIRKTGGHVVLGAQSPGVNVIDSDSRSIVANRWAGRARDAELCAKMLGTGTISRGVDPRTMPHDIPGLGWWSTIHSDVLMRPYALRKKDRDAICARAVELRKGAVVLSAADDDRVLAERVAAVIRDRGVDVSAGRVMLAKDAAAAVDADQMELRVALGRVGVGTVKVSRPDCAGAHNRMHYVLSDFPATRRTGASQSPSQSSRNASQ